MSKYWSAIHKLMETVPYDEAVQAYRWLRDARGEAVTTQYMARHPGLVEDALSIAVEFEKEPFYEPREEPIEREYEREYEEEAYEEVYEEGIEYEEYEVTATTEGGTPRK